MSCWSNGKIQTRNRFNGTLFIRTKHNLQKKKKKKKIFFWGGGGGIAQWLEHRTRD